MAGGTVGGERFRGEVGALRTKDEKREKNIRKVSGRDKDEWAESAREKGRGREEEPESWLALVFEFKYQNVGESRASGLQEPLQPETPVTLTLSLREISEAKWVPWPRCREQPFLDLFLPLSLNFSLFQRSSADPIPRNAARRVLLVF